MSNDEAKQRAKNYMSLKGALEPNQIKCYCGHTSYCDCSPLEERKQTAVEWLEEAVNKKLINKLGPYFVDLFDNAKTMEKEQIIESYEQGDIQLVNAEQYYNETYKKD